MRKCFVFALMLLPVLFALPAFAGDLTSMALRGRPKSLFVVTTASGSVVEARLTLDVIHFGHNELTFYCERGTAPGGAKTVGACTNAVLFAGCDVSQAVAAREDGSDLTDALIQCEEDPAVLGACVDVSGYLLGAPQTSKDSVGIVNAVTSSSSCTSP